MFQTDFKYYKSRCPPPDFGNVIDFSKETINQNPAVLPFEILTNFDYSDGDIYGVKPLAEWKAYQLSTQPGFLIISNPFTPPGQRYWSARVLRDLSGYKSNLDDQNIISSLQSWWQTCICETVDPLTSHKLKRKLRWVTLGYHHNWDTKEYSDSCRHAFPADLEVLCKYIARSIGASEFRPQAAILNFYHEGDTLAGHTDHSEPFKEAPLISIRTDQATHISKMDPDFAHVWTKIASLLTRVKSLPTGCESPLEHFCADRSSRDPHPVGNDFTLVSKDAIFVQTLGQSAIFLIGGETKQVKPSAVFLHSGDICILSGASRLCYHAVPRICLAPFQPWEVKCKDDLEVLENTPSNRNSNVMDSVLWENVAHHTFWKPFAEYLDKFRINLNVRQVLQINKDTLS